ncbi:MAG: hypothetical protein U5K37_02670 [Natrialbaceae archaeon]|nr:hypothetical protein [Natrialbaceae archaeon]
MVDRLQIDPVPVQSIQLEAYDAVGFVDHANPDRSIVLREDLRPDIIIDHHPEPAVEAAVTDIRPEYGATASLFIEYFEELPCRSASDWRRPSSLRSIVSGSITSGIQLARSIAGPSQ